MKLKTKLYQSDVWQGRHRGVSFKVVLHSKGMSCTPGGEGIWNSYIILHEENVPNFSLFWLPDTLYRLGSGCPERVTHDYDAHDFPNVDMHGGITYYAKHGHTKGHRAVEIGCDYNHSWDHERRRPPTLDEVVDDVIATIDDLVSRGVVKETPQ